MEISDFWPRFIIATLATWRVAHLLVSEDGPFNSVVRLRSRLGDSVLGRVMDCFGCASLWIAMPFSLFVAWRPIDLAVTWLALSGAAFLLERAIRSPLVLERSFEETKGD